MVIKHEFSKVRILKSQFENLKIWQHYCQSKYISSIKKVQEFSNWICPVCEMTRILFSPLLSFEMDGLILVNLLGGGNSSTEGGRYDFDDWGSQLPI